jgi:hypothetical protein
MRKREREGGKMKEGGMRKRMRRRVFWSATMLL